MSLRTQHKEDKKKRIFGAAAELFTAEGFERTTIRAIAKEAGVAVGTVFLYARDKQELLAVVFCAEVTEVQTRAKPLLDEEGPLEECLLSFLGEYYKYYGQREELSRVFLKELMFSSRRIPALREMTVSFVSSIGGALAAAQERGDLRKDIDPRRAAGLIFSSYWACLSAWLGGAFPSAEAALDELRAAVRLVFEGIANKPAVV